MPSLSYDPQTKVFVWAGSFEERVFAQQAGFLWHPEKRIWWTSEPRKAESLAKFADAAAKAKLLEFAAGLEASRAASSDRDFPCPASLAYLPFQTAAIAFADGKDNVFLADEMGLGKSIEALGIINSDETIKRTLIVCPASLKDNWLREAKKWLVRPMSLAVWTGQSQVPADVAIVNYDMVGKLLKKLRAVDWDCLIYDEAQYMKNPRDIKYVLKGKERRKPNRAKTCLSLQARRIFMLSGTPIINRPIELFPLINKLAPDLFPNYFAFAKRYCAAFKTRFGWDMTGASNLGELQDKLRGSIMVRRMKEDVLKDLPPKLRQVVLLEPPKSLAKVIQAQKDAWERITDDMGYDAAVAQLQVGGGFTFEEMSEARKILAEAKVVPCVEHIKEILEGDGARKLIVFAHHHELLDGLMAAFGTLAVKIDGRTPNEARQDLVDRFQTDPACRVFIGGIKAAGVGLTLTASSHVILCELPWTPSDASQAEDRAHRIGQLDSVLVQHLIFEGSLDADMAQLILAKQEISTELLDDAPETAKLDLEALAREAAQARPIELHSMAEDLSDRQVERAHELLRYFAGKGGFSPPDSAFGEVLARVPRLTKIQALSAMKMLEKYRRQLPEELYKDTPMLKEEYEQFNTR